MKQKVKLISINRKYGHSRCTECPIQWSVERIDYDDLVCDWYIIPIDAKLEGM